jgi:hypothetical protein
MKLYDLLYQLKSSQILLWYKNSENIGFSFDKNYGFSDVLKVQVKKYKAQLLEILNFNHINSEDKAKTITFYKISDSLQEKLLSPVQKGIYLQCNIDKLSYTYNVPIFIEFNLCNTDDLERAVLLVLQNNPILRMIIGKNFSYDILDSLEIEYADVDENQIDCLCKQRYETPFNVNGGKLIQVEIIRIRGTNRAILNLTHHHILSDAYSVGLIISEVVSYYRNQNREKHKINYFDYIPYLNHQLHTPKYLDAINQLSSKLNNAQILQLGENEHELLDNVGQLLEFKLDNKIYNNLYAISTTFGVSLYAVLLMGLYHVLSLFSGSKTHFPIGLTVSNRPFELKEIIGPFISTLPLIPDYSTDGTILDNILAVNKEIIYLNEHQNINLNILVDKLSHDIEDISKLMRVMFTMHNFHQEAHSQNDKIFRVINVAENVEKFGISIVAKEEANSIRFHISYANQLYNREIISSIMRSFMFVLSQINEKNLIQPINQLPIISSNDYQKIICRWNETGNRP